MYNVIGGVWTDTTFTEIVPGTEEEYGPFESYDEAVKVWRGRMGWMVDTCEHRLFIVQIGIDFADAERILARTGVFDEQPNFGTRTPEPSLRTLVYAYYSTYFRADDSERLTDEYFAALTPLLA
jgi:hypothetical protein